MATNLPTSLYWTSTNRNEGNATFHLSFNTCVLLENNTGRAKLSKKDYSFYVTGRTGWGCFFFQCKDFDNIINQTDRVVDQVVLFIPTWALNSQHHELYRTIALVIYSKGFTSKSSLDHDQCSSIRMLPPSDNARWTNVRRCHSNPEPKAQRRQWKSEREEREREKRVMSSSSEESRSKPAIARSKYPRWRNAPNVWIPATPLETP